MRVRRRKAMRVAMGAVAAAILVSIQSCIFFLPPNALRAVSQIQSVKDQQQSQGNDPNDPEIDLNLNAAGGDTIDVYFEGPASARFLIAEGAARWVGAPGSPVTASDLDPYTATVQLHRRLATRDGKTWQLALGTTVLHEVVDAQGYDSFYLFVCHPAVETRIDYSRSPDFPPSESYCVHGGGWVVDSEPLHVTLTMVPDVADYARYLAAVALGVVLLVALAWFIGDLLRRTAFRRRSPAAIVIGLGAGSILAFVGLIACAVTGTAAGPADNLVLAKDLPLGAYVGSVAGPSLAGLIPGVIFAVLLVRKRPWPDEPPVEEWRPWPVPLPPGPPGSEPPPPLPWTR